MSQDEELIERLREPYDQTQSRRVDLEHAAADRLEALAQPVVGDEGRREQIARIIAHEILAQDEGGDQVELPPDLTIAWLDQGEVDFGKVADAILSSTPVMSVSGEVKDEWLGGDWYERWQDATEGADEDLMATLESLRVRVERTILAALKDTSHAK
jgi:hypothetical protein